MSINFNLKGLLQDEEFLLGAGLLSSGSKGQSLSEGLMPSLVQAGKIKKAFTPTAKKTKQAFDNVLMKNVFVTDSEIATMPGRFTPIDKSQKMTFNSQTGEVEITTGNPKISNLEEKNIFKANDIKNTFSILNKTIPEMQKKIATTEVGTVGGVISLIDTFRSQFSQAADAMGAKGKLDFELDDSSKIDSFLSKNGFSSKAANYAQLKSSVINLSYTLAKIAEPGNPKFSEGDILRQMKRIGVGGSKEQFIASLEQVLNDEYLRASTSYKTLNPKGDFGFTKDGIGTSKKEKKKKDDEKEDDDPFKIKEFL
nr:hypothetical protein [uncultured Mediterranean phage uvMED]